MNRSANAVLFGAYLPIDRRHALHGDASLPERSDGAVLFADISGFTPLTASLTQELGPQRGAEEVTRQLDQVYGALVAEVDRFGGSVISFSGDAITCWFAEDRGRRVVACALRMQAALRDLATVRTPGGKTIALAIKVSAAAGPVQRYLVGDPRQYVIEAAAGRTLDRLDTAQRLAQKGEVLIDYHIAEAMAGDVRLSEWRVDESSDERFAVVAELLTSVPHQAWPTLPDVEAETARNWMLPPVYDRLRSGQGQFLAELRSAVTLFLRFDGIDYDVDEAAGQKLDAFVRWVQQVVDRYGGFVLQLSMGEKGSYLQAAFGAPIAHEHDLQRAAEAALDLLAPPPELRHIHVRIGLSSGQMRTGAYGSPTRRTYGVLGHETNLAARLMQAAQPGQILVSERVAKLLTDFELRPIGSTPLKGVAQPVVIYEVRGRRRSHPAPASAPLIGRALERAALSEKLTALHSAKTGGLFIVEGDAGLGKSRLIAEAAALAQSLGVQTFVTAADAIERSTPFYAWRAIFNQALGLEQLADPAERRAKVMAWLQREPRWQNWGSLLSDILQLDWPPGEMAEPIAVAVQADNVRDLLLGLLDLALSDTNEPTLLIVDDGHWLDSASWALLSRVADQIQPLLIVLATRPPSAPIPSEYQQLLARSDAVHVILEPLPAADVAALVAQRLNVDHAPAAVVDFIRDKAEGHPFFSEELAFALRDAGLIELTDRQCRLKPGITDLRSLDFPSTIQGVITSRIDRLPPQQQLTVKVASIIGRIFTFRLLNDIYPLRNEADRLRDNLDGLTTLDITQLDAPEPDLAYIFKHIITQEVAYHLMLFAQRGELHRAVAEWYERTYAADLTPYYSLLAYHWVRASGDGPIPPVLRFKAIYYLDQAGLQALRNSAYKEASAFFEQAAALEPPLESLKYLDRQRLPTEVRQRAYRYLKLGEAQRGWGTLAESRTSFEWAAVLYGYPLPRSTPRVIGGLLKQLLVQGLHRLQPARYLGRASASQREVLLNTARTYQLISEIFYFTNEGLLSLYSSILCLNLCETAGTSYDLAEAYGVMCVLTGSLGQRRQAEANYQRGLAVAAQLGQNSALAHVLRLSALYRLEDGQWDHAERDLTRAIEILDELGDKRAWGDTAAMLASLAAFRGQFDRAAQLFADMAGPRCGSLLHRILSSVWRGRVANLQGRFEESIALLKAALDLTTDSSDPLMLVHAKIHAWAFLAGVYLRQGRLVLAREAADTTCQLIADAKAGAYQINMGMATIVEVNVALCERDSTLSDQQRQQLLKTAGKFCQQLRRSARASQPRAWYSQGVYWWHMGKQQQAMRAWQKSLAFATELQMPYDEAVVRYAMGCHRPAADTARREHIQRARDLFDAIGAPYDRALAEAALPETAAQKG